MLQEKCLIANIDESTIGRNSQITYSWSKRGTPSEFKNQPFTGSLNIVLTILIMEHGFECSLTKP